jgi:hypothetical protein
MKKSELRQIIKEEIQRLTEGAETYAHNYPSVKDMIADMDRIWNTKKGYGNIGHPRVSIKRETEIGQTGKMKPSTITISGDKGWVDVYSKIAFKSDGTMNDVLFAYRTLNNQDDFVGGKKPREDWLASSSGKKYMKLVS